jgi:peroxiredoxin Q/BCP
MALLSEGERFPVEQLPEELDGPAVVYFYPQDMTRGCELEARGYETLYDRFRALGVEVVGVSVDSEESHRAFAEHCGLRFPLVSDAGGTLTTQLGLMKDYGEYGSMAARVTFLLDGGGTVRKAWTVQDVTSHPQEALEAAEELVR